MRSLLAALIAVALLAPPASAAMTPSEVGEPANGPGVFRFPQALAYAPGGQTVLVGDEYGGRVGVYGAGGDFRFSFGYRALAREPGRLGVVGGVATDRAGRVFVLDSENDRVQVFSPSGAYLASWGDRSVIDALGGDPATGNGISAGGVAVGAGAVYVVDPGFDRVVRVPFDGAAFGTPAFSSGLGLNNPQGVALDPAGTRLYVADDDNQRIVVLDPRTLAFVAQTGSYGTGAGQFRNPYDVAVDASTPNRLYVADNLNDRVDVFDAGSLGVLGAFGRGGRGVPGQFAIVRSVGALADDPRGGVVVADTANNRVQELDPAGNLVAAWGIQGRGPGYVTRPRGVAFAPDGGVTVADTFDHRIERFGPDGAYAGQYGLVSQSTGFATGGAAGGQFLLPQGVAYDQAGNVWVADTGNDRVVEITPDGAVLQTIGGLAGPRAIAAGGCGVVIADTGHGVVQQLGGATYSGLSNPSAVACDGSTVYFADDTGVFRDGAAVPGAWDHPTGLAAGGGALYVAEARRVVKVSGGATTTIAAEGPGAGQVAGAAGLALSADGRTLLVADSGNNRVLRFDEAGVAVPRPPQLTVAVDAITRGRVTSNPPGIQCATDCSQHFGPGGAVTLTAAAEPGSMFTGWSGACTGLALTCTVTMSGDQTSSASFVAAPPPAPPPPPPPAAAVRLSGLRIVPRSLRRRARVTLRLTRPASLTVTVQAARKGRRSGSRCVLPRRSLHRRCTRFATLPGKRSLRAGAGSYAFTLTRRFAGRTLRRGAYRLAVTALDSDGNRVGPLTVRFTVAR
ncbi:SMP-30/gluconolactonase/LRE family protein [Candidatus Solirubrobacter pratensis]|uniref:SMP-30/gluconolactonase/LRE family protein n=1 Tax=Candidatus Solirubrobacter pratensis TaxID=1298857 RepID=UPI000426D1B2|nr:SMP-30/gluconolactonase/LRE family protein [Candidatus Solirubrobacter pratensis]